MGPTMLAARFQQSVTPNALRSYLAEFISTFFFVLAVLGSAMSSRKLMPDATSDPSSLVAVAIANAFALSSAVYIASKISGGHVNPAVTFGMTVGGHISVPTALFYWVSQMLAAVMASLLLKLTVVGQHVPTYTIAEEMTGFGASLLRGATLGGPNIGPLAIGFIAGVGVLIAGPFSGGSMNPACAFGSAVTAGSFKNQAVYWVGPLIGAAVAVLLYDNVVFPSQSRDPVRGVPEAGVGV
ncbi:hypothetical protein I3843_03G088300 [Carya illinoinensis]|uniref:Aquaporin TIP5-1 n=1 Tax=Carya illinoinensis TaxID=32201 RepID=A0A922FIR2_CARIL|nr:hypothetical protein I3760_03G086100 [Carya illinoinensis]KAG6720963.1 hypothetical protein I3842_03G088700 [Carya illinoinensis]KAG7986577.1 hypothetical protein I3843_03G088300 [Carya illinoinensis]